MSVHSSKMPHLDAAAKEQLEERRRRQILDAAARVFARRGFDRATIAEIAAEAHLAEGSIYNYFRSKEDLLFHIPRQLIRPVLEPLLDQLTAPHDLQGVQRALEAIAATMVERVRAHAPFIRVFFSALPRLSSELKQHYLHLLPPFYAAEILEKYLRAGIQRGLLRKDLNPAIAARTLPGMLFIFIMAQEVLLGRKVTPYGYGQIIPETVRLFLFGASNPRHSPRIGRVRRRTGGDGR